MGIACSVRRRGDTDDADHGRFRDCCARRICPGNSHSILAAPSRFRAVHENKVNVGIHGARSQAGFWRVARFADSPQHLGLTIANECET